MSIIAGISKSVRILHRYLGAFAAPALLFFAITGALQTVSLHEPSKEGQYRPSAWLVRLAQLHKKQTLQVQPKKLKHAEDAADGQLRDEESSRKVASNDDALREQATKKSTVPMKIFFVVVSIALLLSTITGLQTAWAYTRQRRVMVFTMLAGLIVPIALLFV